MLKISYVLAWYLVGSDTLYLVEKPIFRLVGRGVGLVCQAKLGQWEQEMEGSINTNLEMASSYVFFVRIENIFCVIYYTNGGWKFNASSNHGNPCAIVGALASNATLGPIQKI